MLNKSKKQEAGSKKQEAGSRKQEAGSMIVDNPKSLLSALCSLL